MPREAGRASGVFVDLQRKLIWLMAFRIIATTLLLSATVIRLRSGPPILEFSPADSFSFAVIGLVYVLTLIYGLVLRRGVARAAVAYAQVMGDVVLATCLTYLTGGTESPFTFTYSIAVVAAAILLNQRGALMAAAASSMAFASLTFAIQSKLLSPLFGAPVQSTGRLAFLLASNVLAQFLIAALASYLSRQVFAAGGQLSAREADLRDLRELQDQIVAAMPSGLITAQADGMVTFANPAAAAILGLDRSQPLPNVETLLPDVLKLKPGTRRAELTVKTDGGDRILGLAVAPLQGRTGSLLIVFQDLTELRRAEEELDRVDHLAYLGQMSAQLAHEIRNPLASMRGSAQMLAADAGPDSSRLAGILIRESDRLSTLVEDFLRFARPPAPALELQSLKAVVADTLEMMRADPLASGVAIDAKLAEVSLPVDGGQLRQALINLLRNAFAAAGPGGKIQVEVEGAEGGAKIRIWDSAGSISAADLPRIFDPFFTTRKGGTGLGLSTAHSIIRAHGGMIQVTSSQAAGTEFVVGLPSPSEV